jgi:hypothetical protein
VHHDNHQVRVDGLLPLPFLTRHQKKWPPACELCPSRSRPDLDGLPDLQDGFPAPQQDRLHLDRCRQWWKATWNEQFECWLWVMESAPASGGRDQCLVDLERHRQKVKGDLGWRIGGPDGCIECFKQGGRVRQQRHPTMGSVTGYYLD